ncbi:MAG: helix-turn-helix transcriptional regulator, partial [Acidimicrobiales bacterium]|nr:helix-turn-helix transcriptional regulator [Acidimicrobiales bacterium]
MVPIVNRSEGGPASGDGGAPADRPESGQEPAGSPREEGHRLRADARRNRAQILKAAEAVFADHGPGAPIDDVARRAGLGVGTLYRHFPTKEALFEAIVLERIGGLAG